MLQSVCNVEIIIPVFNQLAFTRRCLESFFRHPPLASSRVVVIDNGSTDGTAGYLKTFPQIEIINNGQNLGCAAAWNQGFRATGSEWVAFLNNDVVLPECWLDGLLAAAQAEHLDVVSPAMREGPLNYELEIYTREFIQTAGKLIRPNVAHGVCFVVRRRVFEVIGLFDENFRIGQFEDADFFQRARVGEFKLGVTGRSFIHHFGSVTQDSIRNRKDVSPYEESNRAYYRKKWKLGWAKRHWQRLKSNSQLTRWRAEERRVSGHSLHERWIDGELVYY